MFERPGCASDVQAAMDDIELLMSNAWSRLTEMEHLLGQRILDRLRPLAAPDKTSVGAASVRDCMHRSADRLTPGMRLARGGEWWTIERCGLRKSRTSGPVVRLRCRDAGGEIHDFTVPADLAVVVEATDNASSSPVVGSGETEAAGGA